MRRPGDWQPVIRATHLSVVGGEDRVRDDGASACVGQVKGDLAVRCAVFLRAVCHHSVAVSSVGGSVRGGEW